MTMSQWQKQSQELLDLLVQQRQAYARLARLAARQRSLVVADDTEALLATLGERQQVVAELTALSARLAPYRRDWTRVYDGLEPNVRRQVKELLEESNQMLDGVMTADRQDVETLTVRRDSIGADLARTRFTGRAAAAYARSESSGPCVGALAEDRA